MNHFNQEPVVVKRNTWLLASRESDGSYTLPFTSPSLVFSSLDRFGHAAFEQHGANRLRLYDEDGHIAKAQLASAIGEPILVELQVFASPSPDDDQPPPADFHQASFEQRTLDNNQVELKFV